MLNLNIQATPSNTAQSTKNLQELKEVIITHN
jgi:hypothetical protein